MAAEIRGFRESMEAELRAQRESTDVRFGNVGGELRAQRESTEARLDKVEGLLEGRHELIRMLASRLDRRNARFDSLPKWGVGVLSASIAGFGGLIFGAARLITPGG